MNIDHESNSDILFEYYDHSQVNTSKQSLCDEICFLASFLFAFRCVLLLKTYLSSLHLSVLKLFCFLKCSYYLKHQYTINQKAQCWTLRVFQPCSSCTFQLLCLHNLETGSNGATPFSFIKTIMSFVSSNKMNQRTTDSSWPLRFTCS